MKSATVTLLAFVALIGYAITWAEEDPAAIKARTPSPVMEGFAVQENLCLKAGIDAMESTLPKSVLGELIDGDPATGFDLLGLNGSPITISFPGRPPWLNRISVSYRGEIDFEVVIKDIDGNMAKVTLTREDVPKGAGLKQAMLTFDDLQATAFSVKAMALPGYPAEECFIQEVEGYFSQSDTDGGRQPLIITEWVEQYRGTPCGGNNSFESARSAHDLAGWLSWALGWTWLYDWGNSLAWEQDFTNEGNRWDVDQADLAFFKGHGSPGAFWFSYPVFDCSARNTECVGEWGNNNLEWVALSSCQVLHATEWSNWHRCFNGLHLICGMHTNIRSAALGGYFGHYLGWHRWTFPQSWFGAVRLLHPPWGTQIRTAVVLAEVRDNFNDHAWNAGYVSPDPVHNNWYWAMTYTFTGVKEDEPPIVFDAASARRISYPERNNPTILVPEQILQQSQGMSMPELAVVARTVDTNYIRGIADDLCAHYGFFCGTAITDDTTFGYQVVDGQHELLVDTASGGWEYIRTGSYAVPTVSAPSLLTQQQASDSMQSLLNSMGFLPAERVLYDASWLRTSLRDNTTGNENTDSSWNISIARGYVRTHNGYKVAGPGAHVSFDYGANGSLVSAGYNGWRDVSTGSSVSTISLVDALLDLAYSGSDIAIGGMPLCDEFLVDSSFLGYYEPQSDTSVSELPIVWIIYGYCVNQEVNDTSEYELIIPATHRYPRGQIIKPGGDTTMTFGSCFNLMGSATLGTPPYQYNWYSNWDGLLGTGPSISVCSLSTNGAQAETIHTITLEVVDANGAKDYSYCSVIVTIDYGKIPTLSEWGMIIFSLLILTLVTTVVTRRRLAMAGPGGADMAAPVGGALFFPARYFKVLTGTLGLAAVILLTALAISGSLPLRDIAGTIISAGIIAYMAHLWIQPRRKQ